MKKVQIGKGDVEMLGKRSSLQELITSTNMCRQAIIDTLNQGDRLSAHQHQQTYIGNLSKFSNINQEVLSVAELAMEYFFFELTAEIESEADIQKQLIRKLERLPKMFKIWNNLKESLILASSSIQLELKFILTNRNKVSLDDLLMLQDIARQLSRIHPLSKQYCKSILTIITHLRIYRLNATVTHEEKIVQFCDTLIRDQQAQTRLLTLETKVVLLYNCLKTLLGVRVMSNREENFLQKLYEAFSFKSAIKYEEHLLNLFFIIKGFIFRKGKAMQGVEEAASSEDQQEALFGIGVAEKLSNWTSVCLDQTALYLEEVGRSIIRHRVASLATVIEMKLALPRFCLSFLQLMHDGPFNNEAQTIKLCFQLFQAREYQRLNACLQVVLSSPSCKNLRERQVLLSMCSIYTGLYLGDREGALLYAKLNHHEGKKLILRQETLLQHVGFAYLNLATHQLYTCNREVFQTQALSALKASASVNPHNYLTQYCLGKLMLKMGDLQGAYTHAKESLMSGRGQWMPFSLLACVYFCQRRFSKASTLMEQLLKKYKRIKNLHYIRAYLEVNRLLLQVQHDQQVEAAKELGEEIYELTRERVLKNKSPSNLLQFCQEYHQLSLGNVLTEFDENYFYNSPVLNQEVGMFQTFAVGYQETQGEQTILRIIPLLLEAGQFNLVEGLIKSLPVSPLKIYQLALLHQAKGEKSKAITEYKSVLNQQPYHTPSLINLSLLVEDLGDALHYLDVAEKFTSQGKLWLVKGVLLSRLGRIAEAHELFLREGETGWLDFQPDLIYYY